jgi:hypothetical protein
MNTTLYRIWVDHIEQERFESITKGFITQNIHIEAVIPNVLVQYDILLTQEELLLLTLSFKNLEAMRIEKDDSSNVIYVLSDQE